MEKENMKGVKQLKNKDNQVGSKLCMGRNVETLAIAARRCSSASPTTTTTTTTTTHTHTHTQTPAFDS